MNKPPITPPADSAFEKLALEIRPILDLEIAELAHLLNRLQIDDPGTFSEALVPHIERLRRLMAKLEAQREPIMPPNALSTNFGSAHNEPE